ncbi:MAG: hypothetical protein QY314_01550 [Candidatus Dojkabacteria bacterium]|nr:MAG: hypothetical protein QY314_01550 [Candidatus Dojkabacteria bacterium]
MGRSTHIPVNFQDVVQFDPNPQIFEDIETPEKETSQLVEVNAAASRLCESPVVNEQFMHKVYGSHGEVLEQTIVDYLSMPSREKLAMQGGLSHVSPEEMLLAVDILDMYSVSGRNERQINRDVGIVVASLASSVSTELGQEVRRMSSQHAIHTLRGYFQDCRDYADARSTFQVADATPFNICLTLGQFMMFLRENDHILYLGPASMPSTEFGHIATTNDNEVSASVGAARVDVLGVLLQGSLSEDEYERQEQVQRRVDMVHAIIDYAQGVDVLSLLESASSIEGAFYEENGRAIVNAVVLEWKRRIERPSSKQKQNHLVQAGGYKTKFERMQLQRDLFREIQLHTSLVTIYPRSVSVENATGFPFRQRLKQFVLSEYARRTFEEQSAMHEQRVREAEAHAIERGFPTHWHRLQAEEGYIFVNEGWSRRAIAEAERELGLRVKIRKDVVKPPHFVPDDWGGTLTWWFPREDDDLVALIRGDFRQNNENPPQNGPSEELQAFYRRKLSLRKK